MSEIDQYFLYSRTEPRLPINATGANFYLTFPVVFGYTSRTHFNTHSKPRSERFSFSARRDEEIVVDTTMTRSNEAMEENRQNPSGCGHSASGYTDPPPSLQAL